MRSLSCPISSSIINDSEFKVAGLVYIFLLFGYLFSGYLFLVGYVLIDILMRLSPLGKSPVLLFSALIAKAAKLKYSARNEAPKRFALILGSVMLLSIMLAHLYSFNVLAFMITSNLVLLKLLDVVLDYCVGCKLYSYLMLLK
ncbi:MAG: hypothetical protein A2329_08780 [Sulfurimonas sp. RIFOXYB2_FULL_37_5]|jgi:hypothetical protein|uniref:DUF4395 family protein n=1 Tax=unclassified Sulfurimonas TaxID=2623549 RepID=UPI0008C7AD16|nr:MULTISPECIES: DUF4395 family protein [unclassified Sulfurimonas]OHE16175.1 MAG: hypothetical protein A2329_08780 [Sulfurimonas sp. RIFOXYB2_FULL_37_5]MBS4068425.1 DUF4395 family protein [Sulfurimonas sp.]MDD3855956.1 DUF4395 family protein [Sulfurimonas sp.]MDX9756023.1 DUF4395 family protein [Sulfurimonas sp.]OHE06080.1 MAG: hypothetical protein A2345_06430 [Sulfurimonas sp. RIFOXYB12_FULL_35_9]